MTEPILIIKNLILKGINLPLKHLLICLCLTSVSWCSQAANLDTYQLEYITQVKGFKLKALRTLSEKNGIYSLSQVTTTTILETQESALFSLDAKSNFLSINSGYLRKVLGSKLQRTTTFDYKKHQARYVENKASAKLFSIPDIVFDSLTYQERIRFELIQSQGKSISGIYPITDKDRIRDYEFSIIGSEKLNTPLGIIDCIKIERVRKNSDKHTTVWLAKNASYIIVKILHQEDNEPDYQLNLVGGSVNGVTVKNSNSNTTQSVAK